MKWSAEAAELRWATDEQPAGHMFSGADERTKPCATTGNTVIVGAEDLTRSF